MQKWAGLENELEQLFKEKRFDIEMVHKGTQHSFFTKEQKVKGLAPYLMKKGTNWNQQHLKCTLIKMENSDNNPQKRIEENLQKYLKPVFVKKATFKES